MTVVAPRLLDGGRVNTRLTPIAIAITSFDRGGTERQMTELICRLNPARFAVHVLCFRRAGPWLSRVERSSASITEFPLRSLKAASTLRQVLNITRWLRREQIQLVHACDVYANVIALTAAALARVPVRIGSRRGIVSPVPSRAMLPLQRLAYTAAHRVVANSRAAADRLHAEGVTSSKIAVIPNGIDLTTLPLAAARAGRFVTTVANLRAGKGHDVLLRAATHVTRRHPDVRFRLIGDGVLRAELEAQARALGIADFIDFMGHRDDVGVLLGESAVFAFPSLMEAFPNAVMEAMAVGLPVVATNVGGIPELVTDGVTGLLVPASDDKALAGAILRLLEDPGLAARCGAAARAAIAARFSFDQMVSSFETLYETELQSRPRRIGNGLPIRSSIRL